MSSRLTHMRKRIADHWATRVVQWRLRIAVVSRRIRGRIGSVTVSLFGFAAACALLFVPQARSVVDAFQPLEAILSQLGATYGTILALVLTLSIIPIQRAGEVWSPSIVRLYRRDPVTYVTFVALGVLCATSFLLAVRGLAGMPVSIVMAFSLAILGVSLDMLRWYHGHICQLMDPTHAVGLALKHVRRAIDDTKVLVTRVARLQHKLLSATQQRQFSVEDIEGTVYPRILGYPNSVNSWVNDLTEIAIKAVARSEKLLAKAAVFAVADLTIHYLSSRRQNLTLSPAPEAMLLAMKSDVNVVTDRTYESLQEVSRAAVAQSDESTAIRVSEAYQAIAVHTANLSARAFREHSAPLTYAPIYYSLVCVRYAQTKGLDEVAFQTAAILSRIATSVPKNIPERDVYVPVIDGVHDIAVYFYVKRSFGLAEEINGHQVTILNHLLQRQDSSFEDTLRHVLEKIELAAPLAIINETMAGRLSIVHPLDKVYGLVNPNSLGYLFAKAAETLPRLDPKREWLNPYRDVIDIAEIIAEHLRNVAENNEFGESFLIWEIDHVIKHVATVVANIVERPLRTNHDDEGELVDKLHSILAFYWVAFKGKKSIGAQRADDCGDSLVFIGLLFYARGNLKILRSCISSVRSILESYCEIARPPDNYTIGDLLAHLWAIRMLLVARNNAVLVQEVDGALTTKPRGLTDEQWQIAQDAIGRRREQLEERLEERDDHMLLPDSAETLLRRLLREAHAEGH